MVTLQTAENALKSVYLGVVSDQLNTKANPLLTKIKQTSSDVWGKEIIKLAPYALNSGFGAGDETGALPQAGGNKYARFRAELKNLYGKIELSDKAIRASQSSSGAFVNLLNSEMEGLVKASTFNLGRMIFGDGSGNIPFDFWVVSNTAYLKVDSANRFMEGMIVELFDVDTSAGTVTPFENNVRTITKVDRVKNQIYFNELLPSTFTRGDYICLKDSLNKEILGLGAIFSKSNTLYDVVRRDNPWMNPYIQEDVGIVDDQIIQEAIDFLDEAYGSEVDLICCASDVKRQYQTYLSTYRRNIDYMELQGGFKAMSFAGIPIISDRFARYNSMYILNTKDFNLHQLCDWTWLEGDDGRILKQNAGYPTYTATLVKYAELICDKPAGQAMITGITGEQPTI